MEFVLGQERKCKMTRQELEEAIKNGKSVWCICWNNIYEIKATNIQKINKGEIEYFDKIKDFYLEVNLLNIYKSKAEAEHYLHHTNVTRTEKLLFLTWEEFLEEKEIEFTDKNKVLTWLYIVSNKTPNIQLENRYEKLKMWDLTEQNFYKAYDECVKLFMGE